MRVSRLACVALAFAAVPCTLLAQTWTLSARPTLQIGSEDSLAEYQFNQVSHVRRLSNGRILVTMGPDIRYFDADGKFVAKAGGRGQGPGEFQYIQDLVVLPGDTLLVLNFRNKVWLTSDGKFVRQQTMQLGPLSQDGWFSEGARLMPNGNLLAPQYRSEAIEPPPPGLHRPKMRYSILDLATGKVTPLVSAGGLRQITSNHGRGGGVQVFSPHAQSAVGTDRVYVGDNDQTHITMFTSDGIRQREILVSDREVRVTPQLLEQARQRSLEAIGTNAEQKARFEQSWSEVPKPQRLPYWGTALVDRAGNLWVSDYGFPASAPLRWTVINPAGTRIATLQLPPRFAPKDIGTDFVLGVVRDELGVETIQMYTLTRR